MPSLSDRQRVELMIPAYLLYALSAAPGVFHPAGADLAAKAEADIATLRENLRAACLEPVEDLVDRKRDAVLRRVSRISKGIVAEWKDRPALSVMLTLWYLLKDLTDREVLILWEGSAMARAADKLLPMFSHGFEDTMRDGAAQDEASRLLARLRAEGLYG
ncbi:hypothetical protein [Methylobacterium indicum]|uniref:Uncharacterized protein n=1 Tax=Methylobacterium indicum TaxID=1775910 RepID=A0A8H9CA39_9HYPH|nr:hypothetical protein [Methylobacterium indicum]BCM87918.1 hypothetical protein mvi_63790 [Methylobacterium indicum]